MFIEKRALNEIYKKINEVLLRMGGTFGRLLSHLWGQKEIRVLILGLDGAGKTTILYRMQVGEVITTVPTIGFNMETLCYKNIKFNVWDLGGQTSIRPYWRCYYTCTQAIIYVIDSTDIQRLSATTKELNAILNEKELSNIDLLVFANKQDAPNALNIEEISETLNLVDMKERNWTIIPTSAITGEGLNEGLDWLVNSIKNQNNGS
ncbi:hypothetical protein PNEG_01174 [Pneumocystis murina B123]|uniref:ADP-ribosylation factor-like protein 1 n=1 Tax=Pneumocystis murina (strain B123) TaxID=1069680 RepID=M7P9C5_PNEMU|nr:hypothetical protein PNEG_01174 [Pneumocystis murina B123]EMR10460.1 hypothetical protein PNEG_01174 [Pneumocystis murina B123]